MPITKEQAQAKLTELEAEFNKADEQLDQLNAYKQQLVGKFQAYQEILDADDDVEVVEGEVVEGKAKPK